MDPEDNDCAPRIVLVEESSCESLQDIVICEEGDACCCDDDNETNNNNSPFDLKHSNCNNNAKNRYGNGNGKKKINRLVWKHKTQTWTGGRRRERHTIVLDPSSSSRNRSKIRINIDYTVYTKRGNNGNNNNNNNNNTLVDLKHSNCNDNARNSRKRSFKCLIGTRRPRWPHTRSGKRKFKTSRKRSVICNLKNGRTSPNKPDKIKTNSSSSNNNSNNNRNNNRSEDTIVSARSPITLKVRGVPGIMETKKKMNSKICKIRNTRRNSKKLSLKRCGKVKTKNPRNVRGIVTCQNLSDQALFIPWTLNQTVEKDNFKMIQQMTAQKKW